MHWLRPRLLNSEESFKRGPLPRALPPDQVAPPQQTDDSPKSLRTLLFSRFKATVSHESITTALLDHCRVQGWTVVRNNASEQWRGRDGERHVIGQCFHITFANIKSAKAALTHFKDKETASLFDSWATEKRGYEVEPSVDIHRNRPGHGEDIRNVARYWGEAWRKDQEDAYRAQEAQNHTRPTRRASTPHPFRRR